jgi:lysophospholipase L1-like esterase
VAIRGGEAFAPYATRGYRFLRERGAQLAAQGVHFHDLTQLFAETTEPIYIDNIGHLGGKGNEMMAAAMAAQIAKDLAGTAP